MSSALFGKRNGKAQNNDTLEMINDIITEYPNINDLIQ